MGTGKGAAGGHEDLISVGRFLCWEGLAFASNHDPRGTGGWRLLETFRLVTMVKSELVILALWLFLTVHV